MKLYWVSMIIQNKDDKKAWLCAMSSGDIKMEESLATIERGRKNNNVLCAWIDQIEENGETVTKSTVFHECYVDAFGNVQKI